MQWVRLPNPPAVGVNRLYNGSLFLDSLRCDWRQAALFQLISVRREFLQPWLHDAPTGIVVVHKIVSPLRVRYSEIWELKAVVCHGNQIRA